jgi:catechol 2,3-dioxygenase-like lactoylglutathione lyase family enzyme
MLHVAHIESSIKFYERLGFVTVDTDRTKPLGWARIHCEGGAIMFLRAEEPMDGTAGRLHLCMYSPDLIALREKLLADGVNVSAIKYPPYMPSGEVKITDPDGYTVLVLHWGKAEQAAWEKRIGAKV